MKESIIRELIRMQDTIRQIIPYNIWQSWAIENEKIIIYLQENNSL